MSTPAVPFEISQVRTETFISLNRDQIEEIVRQYFIGLHGGAVPAHQSIKVEGWSSELDFGAQITITLVEYK